ncbi:hypothetical protein [Halodesulfovibrio spirochaetisodalis]|uniref:Uncharacterized protein n=1 Tax=Halodesulfovibrio spirochaetisodalis TaxID=1560234 RepID=A0A1B7XC84_9BACT|nr:hypothetical protein [Halodesulfovibrio spirochaetisodalis]OBQ51505.1 hypothetical protein SP90_09860 [Halodesulfovibrio spirochaetisodalis]
MKYNKKAVLFIQDSLYFLKGSGAKPRENMVARLNSLVKVFGESREAFFQKGSLAAGGKQAF